MFGIQLTGFSMVFDGFFQIPGGGRLSGQDRGETDQDQGEKEIGEN
jgi:hypothetical protein